MASTAAEVRVPGRKISRIPMAFRLGMSCSGMMPPAKTAMSVAPCSFSSRMISGKSTLCAPERIERPMASTSSWTAAETAIPGRRLADEESEPARARDPIDVVERCVADVGAVVAPLDREMPLVGRGMHGAIEPLDLVLKRDRITRLQRTHDVGIVQPAVAALGVLALEGPQDDMLAGDHEPPPPRLARLGREVTLGAISHPRGII